MIFKSQIYWQQNIPINVKKLDITRLGTAPLENPILCYLFISIADSYPCKQWIIRKYKHAALRWFIDLYYLSWWLYANSTTLVYLVVASSTYDENETMQLILYTKFCSEKISCTKFSFLCYHMELTFPSLFGLSSFLLISIQVSLFPSG